MIILYNLFTVMNINLNKMSDAEKLDLISKIWDSISLKDEIIPVDTEHEKIIEEREKNDKVKISWDAAKEQIRKAL